MTRPLAANADTQREAVKPSIRLAALRVPLAAKLVGANLVVAAVVVGAVTGGGSLATRGAIIAGALVAHLVAVFVALRPIRDLESTVMRVWRGDYAARVDPSVVADHGVLRVGAMFNVLLDGMEADRSRMRALAADVIDVTDRDRAALARELHDSTAQQLAAILLELSVVAKQAPDPAVARRLMEIRNAVEALTEEVRVLSHTVHPRVLDDLGLAPALHKLARESSAGTGIRIDVDIGALAAVLPRNVSSILYRVAEESLVNAARHGAPRSIRVIARSDAQSASIEIHDDGRGFDLADTERHTRGHGLRSLRERLALVDGRLEVKTAPRSGTTLAATVPLPRSSAA